MIHRICVVAGCLMLLGATVSAEQTQTSQPPLISVQPLPIPPLLVKPMANQPVRVEPLADPRTGAKQAPTTMPNSATAPATIPLPTPAPAPGSMPPPLGSELKNKLQVDEQHFVEKNAAAKRDFDLREAAQKQTFQTTLSDKGFWERRRLNRVFRTEQAARAKEFNDELEAKRRTYEWRYP